jgi:hypothetical protein
METSVPIKSEGRRRNAEIFETSPASVSGSNELNTKQTKATKPFETGLFGQQWRRKTNETRG